MMIGIIGVAAVGQTLARRLISAGERVTLSNSRGPDSLTDLVASMGPLAAAGAVADAAKAPIVLLAVPWTKVVEVLAPLKPWDGRILVDTTNIFQSYAPAFDVAELGDETGSEIVARLAPGARVVKAFNTLPMSRISADPPAANLRRVLFLAGDYPDANAEIARLIERMNLSPVDLGTLRSGGQLMELRGPLSTLELFRSI